MYEPSKTVQVLRMEINDKTSPTVLYAFAQLAENMAACYPSGSLRFEPGYREFTVLRDRSDDEIAKLRDGYKNVAAPRTEPEPEPEPGDPVDVDSVFPHRL